MDGGADTCVVGTGWAVTSTSSRRANVVGFDDRCFTANALPIGTACAMVALSDGEEIMIRVHEAVLNEGGPTLLSKYQIRDHGLGVSDKAPQHGGSPHIELEPGRRLQLHMHGALAVLRVRTPTDEELRTLIPVDITSDDLWDPRKYDPGGGNIAQSPANTIRIHIAQRSRPLPEMDSTMTEDRQTRLSRVRFRKADVDKLIPKFIYRNRDIIAHTLENTTALARCT